eukprot:CFRG7639T1
MTRAAWCDPNEQTVVKGNQENMKTYCGPGMANCCLVLSVWGILQLAVLGLLFERGSIGLYHEFEEGHQSEVAMNCFIAAGIYVGTLIYSIYCVSMNNRDAKNDMDDQQFEIRD